MLHPQHAVPNDEFITPVTFKRRTIVIPSKLPSSADIQNSFEKADSLNYQSAVLTRSVTNINSNNKADYMLPYNLDFESQTLQRRSFIEPNALPRDFRHTKDDFGEPVKGVKVEIVNSDGVAVVFPKDKKAGKKGPSSPALPAFSPFTPSIFSRASSVFPPSVFSRATTSASSASTVSAGSTISIGPPSKQAIKLVNSQRKRTNLVKVINTIIDAILILDPDEDNDLEHYVTFLQKWIDLQFSGRSPNPKTDMTDEKNAGRYTRREWFNALKKADRVFKANGMPSSLSWFGFKKPHLIKKLDVPVNVFLLFKADGKSSQVVVGSDGTKFSIEEVRSILQTNPDLFLQFKTIGTGKSTKATLVDSKGVDVGVATLLTAKP